ncbi:hypothetical protein GCM10010299_46440 [Streptomyces tanashiensis]|nr:hypothetical protein GCM10010299_46440 [Streptomyces tanashiensis]
MRLAPHLPKSHGRGGRWCDHRQVINGILFRVRTGVPWRDLPERFGSWKTVYERHRRWSADGTRDGIFQALLADPDAQGRVDWSRRETALAGRFIVAANTPARWHGTDLRCARLPHRVTSGPRRRRR